MASSRYLNDVGEEITANACPATMTIADSTAAGWSGPVGDEVWCELPRGHEGLHRCSLEWSDQERSYGWEKRSGG